MRQNIFQRVHPSKQGEPDCALVLSDGRMLPISMPWEQFQKIGKAMTNPPLTRAEMAAGIAWALGRSRLEGRKRQPYVERKGER